MKACQLGPEVNHHFALTCNPQQGTKSVISCCVANTFPPRCFNVFLFAHNIFYQQTFIQGLLAETAFLTCWLTF